MRRLWLISVLAVITALPPKDVRGSHSSLVTLQKEVVSSSSITQRSLQTAGFLELSCKVHKRSVPEDILILFRQSLSKDQNHFWAAIEVSFDSEVSFAIIGNIGAFGKDRFSDQ